MFDYQLLTDSLIFGKFHFFTEREHREGDPLPDINEIREWCAEEFGRPGKGQVARWYGYMDMVWFRDAADACAFRLRWC